MRQLGVLRRAAGRVRDIDVQLEIARQLPKRDCGRDLKQLVTSLQKKRQRREEELVGAIEHAIKASLRERITRRAGALETLELPQDLTAIASEFVDISKRAHNPTCLHEFRITCKHLRYRAELAPDSPARALLIKRLIKLQDVVGEWHDTAMLCGKAQGMLEPARPLVSILNARRRAKLNEAMRVIPKLVQSISELALFPPRKPASPELLRSRAAA